MPRYFFHLKRPGEAVLDDIGKDLPDIRLAHDYGVRMARALERDLPDLRDDQSWFIEVSSQRDSRVVILMKAVAADKSRTFFGKRLFAPNHNEF